MNNKNINISHRLGKLPSSPIRTLVPYAQAAVKKGVNVYQLNIGDPDIKSPQVMLNVLKQWTTNPISYAQSKGDSELIISLVWYYKRLGFNRITSEHIQVTLGGSEAISMALFAVCDPGDEVIVFEPLYANYITFAALNGISLIPIETGAQDNYHLPLREIIEKKITSKTKAILFCNPNNPTGTVYTRKEIEMLIHISQEHNLFLLADEVYREFVYDNRKHISLIPYMKYNPTNLIVLDSLSKRYSLCGARLGVLVCMNNDIMQGVLRIAMGRLSAGLVDQKMAAQLTQVPQKYFTEVIKKYQERRDIMYRQLSKIPGVELLQPEGAFYSMVTLPVLDASHFCQWLLTDFRYNNETVMLAPASGFYLSEGKGKTKIRFAYVLHNDSIKKAITIIRQALQQYSGYDS